MAMKNKPLIGLLCGIAVFLIIYFIPIAGMSFGAHTLLALTLMTVVFWAFQITQPAYVSAVFLTLVILAGVVPAANTANLSGSKLIIANATSTAAVAFRSWTGQNLWLIIGAYLIAAAVQTSGLGQRIAYNYMLCFVKDFKSVIVGIFVLTFVLSLLIPHPWPRALMIMAVMSVIIKSSNIPKEDGVKIGFSVFAASVPVSLIFMTGDATINILAADYAGGLSFLGWFITMGVPALVGSVIALIMILAMFKPSKEITINNGEIKGKIASLGKMTVKETKTLVWIVIAIILWITDSLHGFQNGWVALIIGALLGFPLIGGVLTPKDWGTVPVQTLIFLSAAMAIGSVGGATGMNNWIAATFLGGISAQTLSNPFVLAAIVTVISVILHMLLGSVIAVMGVALPSILALTNSMGMDPAVPTVIAYFAIASHYIFPFQHLNMLVGSAEDQGGYSQKETIKMGIPYTVIVFFVNIVIFVPWLKIIGKL